MKKINILNDWIKSKELSEHQKNVLNSIFDFILTNFKELKLEIKWNEPMFSFDGTFIIAISAFKKHISISPERYVIDLYKNRIEQNNYVVTSNLFKIDYNSIINWDLISDIINFKMDDKKNCKTYFKTSNCK